MKDSPVVQLVAAQDSTGGGIARDVVKRPPADYYERKVEGWCVYSSACPRRAAGDSQFCEWHRLRRNARQRRDRAENVAQGKCRTCRKPSSTYRCPACSLREGRLQPTNGGVAQDVADKRARIAARTKTHADGRTRYHGQSRRGQQSHAQLDEQDIGFARKEIELGERGLQRYAREVERSKAKDPEAMPRIQRDDLRSAAVHQLERAVGHLTDVMSRHGHVMQDRSEEAEE